MAKLRLLAAYPPDAESVVMQVLDVVDETVDIPAEIQRQDGQLILTLVGREEGLRDTYPAEEFVAALQSALTRFD